MGVDLDRGEAGREVERVGEQVADTQLPPLHGLQIQPLDIEGVLIKGEPKHHDGVVIHHHSLMGFDRVHPLYLPPLILPHIILETLVIPPTLLLQPPHQIYHVTVVRQGIAGVFGLGQGRQFGDFALVVAEDQVLGQQVVVLVDPAD